VIDAADAAGVKHIVFISFLESSESFPLQDAKRVVENRIKESKMTYTILRPTFFMDIWLSPHLGFDPRNHTVTIYGNGTNKISWISIKDVAKFAAESVDNPYAVNKVIDLGGPEALSPLEVVSLFNDNKIDIKFIPEEALRAQKQNSDNAMTESFSGLMLTYASGAIVPMNETRDLFGIDLVPVKQHFGLN
jgi:uncharacterized protein YbjT (DUF2867 family)